MQKLITMRGALCVVVILALCQVDGTVASSRHLHSRKLAQQPLPGPVADSVDSTAVIGGLRWVPVEDGAFTPAVAKQLAMMYSMAPPTRSNRTIGPPLTASAITGGNRGGSARQREMQWGPILVTTAGDPSGIAVTASVQVLFWNITLGSDKLTADQPMLAFGHPDILSVQFAADFSTKTGTITLQMGRRRYNTQVV